MSPVGDSLSIGYAAGALPFGPRRYDTHDAARISDLEHKSLAYVILEEWHRREHVGRFVDCPIQPCHAVIIGVWG